MECYIVSVVHCKLAKGKMIGSGRSGWGVLLLCRNCMLAGGEMAKYEYWITEEGLTLLNGWARDGLTNEEIADNCGISRETLNQWKHKFSDISDALKGGKEVADYRVENALYEAALGGNVTAMIFWLKNRKPQNWREKPEDTGSKEPVQIVDDI